MSAADKSDVRDLIQRGYNWRDAIKTIRQAPVRLYDVRPYGSTGGFTSDLPGHEVLNNKWLEIKGIIPARGIGWQSLDNPAIAIHHMTHSSAVQKAQRALGVWYAKDLALLGRGTIISRNMEALRFVGVPEEAVQRIRRAAIIHARSVR